MNSISSSTSLAGWFPLVALLGGLAALLSSVASSRDPARQEWSAATAEVLAGRTDVIHIEFHPVTDAQPGDLKDASQLRVLLLDRGRISDDGAETIASFPALRRLRLRESPLTDRGLKALAGMKELRSLNLPQGQFSDVGLRSLAEIPQLEYLRFSSPQVTAGGLQALGQMKSLRWLHLVAVPLDKAALEQIATLPRLESLYVDDVPLADADWEAFFERAPGVHVHIDQRHHDRDPARHPHPR